MVVPTHILANMNPDDFLHHLETMRNLHADPQSDENDLALLEHALALRFHELCNDIHFHFTARDRYDFCINTLAAAQTTQNSVIAHAVLYEICCARDDAADDEDVALCIDCHLLILNSF